MPYAPTNDNQPAGLIQPPDPLDAIHVHALGPRAVFELLAEIAGMVVDPAQFAERLAAYRRLTPAMIQAAGGGGMPCHFLVLI